MIAAQETMFGTALKGSRLVRGEVPFSQIVSPGVGVVYHRAGILMPGEEEPPPTRFSMQLFVVFGGTTAGWSWLWRTRACYLRRPWRPWSP